MQAKTPSSRREAQNLAVRYGEIGISAVAAAMRYQGEGRAAAPAPSNARGRAADRWLDDMLPEAAA